MFFKKKGKILKIKTGYNPNSSSIGTDLMPLLIGGSIMALIIPFISIIISRRLNKNKTVEKDKTKDTDD